MLLNSPELVADHRIKQLERQIKAAHEALANLENDEGIMPWTAWALVQEALTLIEGDKDNAPLIKSRAG